LTLRPQSVVVVVVLLLLEHQHKRYWPPADEAATVPQEISPTLDTTPDACPLLAKRETSSTTPQVCKTCKLLAGSIFKPMTPSNWQGCPETQV
jgi:hypothetical protein